MFRLTTTKKVAVRIFTVLSLLFIIQTSAWAQTKLYVCGNDWTWVAASGLPAGGKWSTPTGSNVSVNPNGGQWGTNVQVPSGTSYGNIVYTEADGKTTHIFTVYNAKPQGLDMGTPVPYSCESGSKASLNAAFSGIGKYTISWSSDPNILSASESKTYNNLSTVALKKDVEGLESYSSVAVTLTVTSTTVNGCSDSKTVTLTRESLGKGGNVTDATCDGEYTLRASKPDGCTGVWSVSSGSEGGDIVDVNAPVTEVINIPSGKTGKYKWTIKKGPKCTASYYYNITNNGVNVADYEDIYLCNGDKTKTIASVGSATVASDGGAQISNKTTITIPDGTYGAVPITLTFNGSNGCPDVEKTFTVYRFPKETTIKATAGTTTVNSANNGTATLTICSNDVVTLEAAPLMNGTTPVYPAGTVVEWVAGAGVTISDPSNLLRQQR